MLAALDPNDPQPLKDDPRCKGNYGAFRKAYEAWNARECGQRKRQKRAAELAADTEAAAAAAERAAYSC